MPTVTYNTSCAAKEARSDNGVRHCTMQFHEHAFSPVEINNYGILMLDFWFDAGG